MNACVLVPAFDAARTVGQVLRELRDELARVPVIVIDDGSRDDTAEVARAAGAHVVVHGRNLGKGASIRAGLHEATRLGHDVALTVDADGQHPAASARAVLESPADPRALVLGVRDLARANAPAANQWSNGVSNYWISRLSGRAFDDTQCGLRRYPIATTLALGARADGFAFEAEVLLRAVSAKVPIVELPIAVRYPPSRTTHFHVVRDPTRIILAVARTVLELHFAVRPGIVKR
jgi:glycosyltransferase involved in cell wall biosynthesis